MSNFVTGIPEADEAPVIDSLTPGNQAIALSWTAPSPGTGITAYDLRYIRSDAPNKADDSWTTRSRIWTSGTLEYTLRPPSNRLVNGVTYQLQVRAVSGSDAGEWSHHRVCDTADRPRRSDLSRVLLFGPVLRG